MSDLKLRKDIEMFLGGFDECVWDGNLQNAVELLGRSLAALRESAALKLALSLNCEVHGCTSEKCTAAAYHGDAEKMLRESAADKQRIAELEAELASARDLIEKLKQEERWIPVGEGLPTVRALTYTPNRDISVQYRIVPEGLSRTLTDATHWRPLPAPPEGNLIEQKEKQA